MKDEWMLDTGYWILGAGYWVWIELSLVEPNCIRLEKDLPEYKRPACPP